MGYRISQLPSVSALEKDDVMPIVHQPNVSDGLRQISLPNLLIAGGKVLYVDATQGVDAQGSRGSLLSYLTLAAAKAAAQSGDLIVVLPGTYQGNNLLKDGVDWYFMPNAVVQFTNTTVTGSSTVYGIFDDRDGAVTCRIRGAGVFYFDAGFNDGSLGTPNSTIKGAIYLQNSSSEVSIECQEIQIGSYIEDTNPYVFAVRVDDCSEFTLRCEKILDIDFQGTAHSYVSTANGVYYGWGKVFIEVDEIKVNNNGVIATQKAAPSGSGEFHLNVGRIENYVTPGPFAVTGGTTRSFQTFIRCGLATPSAFANDIYAVTGGGVHAFHIDRIYSLGNLAVINVNSDGSGNAADVVAYVGYAETQEYLFIVETSGAASPNVSITCPRYVATGTTGKLGLMANGKVTCVGGYWACQNTGVVFNGGTLRLKDVTIDCSTAALSTHRPVEVAANGLILEGVTLLTNGSADSIYAATAKNVKVYGTSVANRAKNANVTIQVGTLTVDSNVT